jgi:hypothetical protein
VCPAETARRDSGFERGLHQVKRIFAILPLLLIVGCVETGPLSGPPGAPFANSGRLSGTYAGADAGYLVMALAARSDTEYSAYTIMFRSIDRASEGGVWWGQENALDRRREIDDAGETGIVDVRRLPPGKYEIFNFDILYYNGLVPRRWRSEQDFSIPFTIAPGRTTYVGEFMAVKLTRRNIIGATLSNGAYFVLSDKSDRDVAIARQKEPGLGEATDSVIDPKSIANPLITGSVY